MLCVKFGWNWPSGSGEEDFKISIFCINIVRFVFFFIFVIISPLPQKCFVQSLTEMVEKMKMWKVYRQSDRRTYDWLQPIRRKAFSSGELKYDILLCFLIALITNYGKGCVKSQNYQRFNLWSHACSIKFFTYIIRYTKIELLKISGWFFCEFSLI